jgi:aspartate-semialdehyde dehydrogenase
MIFMDVLEPLNPLNKAFSNQFQHTACRFLGENAGGFDRCGLGCVQVFQNLAHSAALNAVQIAEELLK